MPYGPRGQHRPADVVGCAVKVARIATGEIEDTIKLRYRDLSTLASLQVRRFSQTNTAAILA